MIDDHGYDGNHINVIVINNLELDQVNIAIKGASLFRINQWLTIYQSVNITNLKKWKNENIIFVATHYLD